MKDIYNKEIKHDRSDENAVKILIAENVPSLNKGEMAILEGMLESFRSLGKVEVSMLSAHPETDASRYPPPVRTIDIKESWPLVGGLDGHWCNKFFFAPILLMFKHAFFLIAYKVLGLRVLRFFRGAIWQEYLEADVIIEGHDGNFGIGGDPESPLFYPLYLPLFAKMLAKPTVLYAGSIRRVRRFRWRIDKVFKFVLGKIDLITLRENVSYQNLKDIGLQSNRIFVTADLAFLLQPVPLEQVEEIMRREGIDKASKPLIGMTVTREIASKAFPELTSPESSYQKHIEMLAQVIDDLTDKLNASVIFMPHCIGLDEKLDDRIVAKDIFWKCANKDKVKVITNEYGPEELKGLIGQFDFFIGERVHSVINAMSMCVPSIVISWSSDQRLGIIKMVGQENAICYVDGLDANTLISKIEGIWSKREKIKIELKSQIEIMRERAMLNGKLLKELLKSRRV